MMPPIISAKYSTAAFVQPTFAQGGLKNTINMPILYQKSATT
jgi:hypothetical protein